MATDSSSSGMFWAGSIVSGLVILFLVFDGGTKVLKVAPVVEACEKLGLPSNTILGIGAVLLVRRPFWRARRSTPSRRRPSSGRSC